MTTPPPGTRQNVPGARLQTFLNVLSLLVVLFAAYEALGVDNLFAYQGLSNDDAEANMMGDMLEALFDPIGFVIMLGLLIASIVIYVIALNSAGSDTMPKVTLVITSILFVLGFFKVTIIIPMLFSAAGSMGATTQNAPDNRAPIADEYTLDAAELIQYQGGDGVRVATAVTNAGSEHWQSATVSIGYSDANGIACGQLEHEAEFVAPGERRMITTDFLAASIAYSDPACVPASATADLTNIDIDSRAEIASSDYEQARDSATLTPLTGLSIFEQPDALGITYLAVAGSIDPAALPGLVQANGEAALPLGFETVDQQGLRLVWCFEADDITADGTFTTGKYHSPVDPGQFVSVAVVPRC